ncbi:MAG: calcium/sodium antiporter [Betaproteobacteria bacterium]|nr:MAG: calcium/sodium antiporter [Betaproteobacteria bacterium]
MLWFVIGLVALIAGAELLVRGASRLALAMGISPLVVGLTVVAFGTSSPELSVSVQSAWSGQVDIALGNVVGSNIFNVLFILGLSALITPLLVHEQLVRREVPVMIGVSLLLWALAADGAIGRLDGIVLAGLLTGYTVVLIRASRRDTAQGATADGTIADAPPQGDPAGAGGHWALQVGFIAAGLALLVLGSNWLVEAAVGFARALGVSELVIGLTLIAAGTSLPEVATSITAALRGERDIAVGNVVGSNVFNILGVLGVSAIVSPAGLDVAPSMPVFDLPVMVAVALACLPVFFTGRVIARWEGALFFAYYLAYTAYLILMAREHDALQEFGLVVAGFALPLTFITLFVLSVRQWRMAQR